MVHTEQFNDRRIVLLWGTSLKIWPVRSLTGIWSRQSVGANWWEKKPFLILVQKLYNICACWMLVPCAVSAIFISGQFKLFCCSVIPYFSIPSDSIHVLTKTSTSSRQRTNYLTHFKSLRWFRWVGLCKWGYCFPWKCFYHNISSNLEAGIEILLSFAIVL